MTYSFTGNLHGKTEYIFRQGMGREAHIILNLTDYQNALHTNNYSNLRVDTLCGKNLKYSDHETYGSTIGPRDRVVRNACEYCFTEWEPDDNSREELIKALRGDLPF